MIWDVRTSVCFFIEKVIIVNERREIGGTVNFGFHDTHLDRQKSSLNTICR